MDNSEKQELISKLADSRENIKLLQNMLKKEQWNVEQELRLVAEAMQYLNDVLFDLTGDEFYKETGV
jgi:hypothetical protein